jgi:hypothetical protein
MRPSKWLVFIRPSLAGFDRPLTRTTTAIEVKSGRRPESLPGMDAFAKHFKPKRKLLVGGQGIALDEFLSKPAAYWLQ